MKYLDLYKRAYHMDDFEAMKALFTATMTLMEKPQEMSELELKCLPNIISTIGTATSRNARNIPDEYKKYALGTWEVVQEKVAVSYFTTLGTHHEKLAKIHQEIKEENESHDHSKNHWLYNSKNWLLSATFAPEKFCSYNTDRVNPYAVAFIEKTPAIFQSFLEQESIQRTWTYLFRILGNANNKDNIFYEKEKILLSWLTNAQENKMLLVAFQEDGKVKKAFYTDLKTELDNRVVTDHFNTGISSFSDNKTDAIVQKTMPIVAQCQQRLLMVSGVTL